MTARTPVVLYVGDPIAFAHEDWVRFQQRFNIITHEYTNPEEIISALKPGGKYDSIQAIVRPSNPTAERDVGPFTKEIIAHLPPSLKIISSVNHGYENEDTEELGRKGILYCNGAGGANDSTADIAAYLLVAAFRYTSFFERMLRGVASERHYNGKNPSTGHNGFFLQKLESSHYNIIGTMAMAASDNPAGRILGVIGMGQVGLAAGKRAVALGMRIHYHGRSRKAAAIEDLLGGATFHTELKTMLEIADCVLLACPYNTTTHHILDKDAFAVMKRGVRIVNVGRGKCMDEGALAEAIELGIVAGAGLDVFYDEPVIHPKLLESWRVTILPHIGGDSSDSKKNFERIALRNIEDYFLGSGVPLTAVNHI